MPSNNDYVLHTEWVFGMASVRGGFWASPSPVENRDPSVSKSNRLHADIFRLFFDNLRYILKIPLTWQVIFLKSWTATGDSQTLTGSSVTSGQFSQFMAASTYRQKMNCLLSNLPYVIPALVEIHLDPMWKEYSIVARVKVHCFRASSTVFASEDIGWHQDHRVQTVGNQTFQNFGGAPMSTLCCKLQISQVGDGPLLGT